jgi:twinkle protein
MQIYEDGSAFCFSCQTPFKADVIEKDNFVETTNKNELHEVMSTLESRGCKARGITKRVSEFFGVKVSYDTSGEIDTYYYPYGDKDNPAGYKVRELPKAFRCIGKLKGLFGQTNFSSGKRLVITEGEFDAMAVAQAFLEHYGNIYPVVSIPAGAGSHKFLLEEREWIRGFDEVILMFDMDDVGKKEVEAAARVVGADKVKIAHLPEKDPCDVLIKHGYKTLLRSVWDAKQWSPAGILNPEDIWKQLEEYNTIQSIPYPGCIDGLNSKLKGMRLGEITLWTSGTGSGKSTILREILVHLLDATPDKIGVISLEESPAETARKLSGMVLNKNPSAEEIPLEELRVGFDKVFGDGRVVVLDHQGSINDSSIVQQLEFMCLMGCKYLFIDHITILVSEGADGLEGNAATDKVMNDLLRLVKKHNVWIGLISHLRKTSGQGKSFEEGKLASLDDIRGSGSIKQISMDIVAFARDMLNDDETKRNSIKMRVLKCRYTGLTGNVGGAKYDHKTGRLQNLNLSEFENEFEI